MVYSSTEIHLKQSYHKFVTEKKFDMQNFSLISAIYALPEYIVVDSPGQKLTWISQSTNLQVKSPFLISK